MSLCKPISILCTPRVGSNLLLYSLANHPQAINGGEWFNCIEPQNYPDVWRNKQERPEQCNLRKFFIWDRVNAEFDRWTRDTYKIYLYRRDTEAQLASWQKACQTGVWIAGHYSEPTEFPSNARLQISHAAGIWWQESDMRLAYESMVDDWQPTIERILTDVGWSVMPLEMGTEYARIM